VDDYAYAAICKTCRVEILSSDWDTTRTCPLCDHSLVARSLYLYGPASTLGPENSSENSTGGSVFPSKSRIKEVRGKLELVVTADICDICASVLPPGCDVHPFRIGRTHYAACGGCYAHIEANLVRLPRTKFRNS